MYRLNFKILGALFVKHYTENFRKYLFLYGATIAAPMLFGALTHMGDSSYAMIVLMNIIGTFAVMHISMNELRSRRSAIISNTLPASVVERYAFIFINTTVVFLACFALTAYVSKVIVDSMFIHMIDFSDMYLSNDKYWVNLLGVHATAMIINAVARRSLIAVYAAAIIISAAKQYLTEYISEENMMLFDDVKLYINMVMVPLLWALSFVALKRKQIKW